MFKPIESFCDSFLTFVGQNSDVLESGDTFDETSKAFLPRLGANDKIHFPISRLSAQHHLSGTFINTLTAQILQASHAEIRVSRRLRLLPIGN